MQLEIHSTTWTSLRRIIGSSSEIHEVSSATNIRCSCWHLRGTVHITCWDRGLSKFQTLVCLIWWSFQPNIFVSWTFSNWWTTYPVTCCWFYWSSDYHQGLHQRQRWQRTSPNLQPGDLVLLREDNTIPLHWPTAVIKETYPGKDGIVRVVTLTTPKGIFKRPITKMCPLPRVNDE